MRRTSEEKRAWHEQMRGLAARVRALSAEERERLAEEYGTITAEGHRLSPFNCVFLAMVAGFAPAQVGGYRQWQRVGRSVREGEHAVGRIWVPAKGKKDEGDEDGRQRFVLVPVFDVTQTEELAA